MGKKIITFTDIEVENINFIDTKDLSIDDVNINEIIVSNKVPFGEKGFKFFVGYKNDRNVRLSCGHLHNTYAEKGTGGVKPNVYDYVQGESGVSWLRTYAKIMVLEHKI